MCVHFAHMLLSCCTVALLAESASAVHTLYPVLPIKFVDY